MLLGHTTTRWISHTDNLLRSRRATQNLRNSHMPLRETRGSYPRAETAGTRVD